METDDEAGLRMRRRAFLNETARLRRRQSGVTPRHDTILEGVYELEPTPDFRTEARLAHQLNLDPVAVKTWFRNRRVRDKRANHRAMGSAIMLIVFVVLACVYLFELDGMERLMEMRRETAPANRQFRTKSGLPRPYKTKAPFEQKFKRPKDPKTSSSSTGTGTGKGTGTGTGTGTVRKGTSGTGSSGSSTGTSGTLGRLFSSSADPAGGVVRRATAAKETSSTSSRRRNE